MPDRQVIYLDNPDPLSVLLSRLELTADVHVDGEFCGTWAIDNSGSRRIPFHIVGKGEAWLHFHGATQLLEAGDFVVFPQDEHHVLSNSRKAPPEGLVNAPMSGEGKTTNVLCGFFDFENPSSFPVLESLPPVVLSSSTEASRRKVSAIVRLMLDELEAENPGYYASVDQLAFLLFIEVIRQEVARGEVSSGLLAALFDARIGRALSAIHLDPSHPWDLEALAAKAAMSRSTFAQRFRSLLNVTPMKYLTLWRINEAKRMLQRTQLSMAQIAERSGYASEAAFRTTFRQIIGEPPGAYRTRIRATVCPETED